MKNYLTFLCKSLSIGMAIGILVLPVQATNKNLHPWAQRIIEIINTQGQAALCKEGGIFRERNSVLSKPGEKCKNKDFAELALTMCNNPDFKNSKCYFNAGTLLGSAGIAAAPVEVEQGVKLKHLNTYAVVCNVKRENLQGIILAIANRSCDNKTNNQFTGATPARPQTAAPVMTAVEKQRIKGILQRDIQILETLKTWVSAKPTTQRGNLAIGSERGAAPFKIPAPTDPSQKDALLAAAQNVAGALKKLNASLDSPEAPIPSPEVVNKLEQFTPQITENSSIAEMLKRLDEMQRNLNQMK